MDIEEYLRQKRELEAKKEMLEAKEKVVDHDKERFKKEQRAKLYAEHGVTSKHTAPERHSSESPTPHYSAPSAGSGIWNTILLFLILILLVVSYFLPRFGEEQIRGIVKQESDSDDVNVQQDQDDEPQDTSGTLQDEPLDDEPQDEPIPEGPDFTISAKDDEEGLFDEDGKLDGEILVVNIESGLQYYEDFTIEIDNLEQEPIVCKIDREVQIDTNFDGRMDITREIDPDRFKIELDPRESETIASDVVPGTVDTGTYEGKGDIHTTYEARCYFCLDDDCNKVDDTKENVQSTFFRVWINRDAFTSGTNSSTNNSN